MQSALAALQAELGTELLSQLDSSDQREVCALQSLLRFTGLLMYVFYMYACFTNRVSLLP